MSAGKTIESAGTEFALLKRLRDYIQVWWLGGYWKTYST